MSKVFCIASHEYLWNVKRKEFIMITIGMPVLMLFFGVVGGMGTRVAVSQMMRGGRSTVGIVDHSGQIKLRNLDDKADSVKIFPVVDEDSGKEEVKAGKLAALIVVGEDYLEKGTVEVYKMGGGLFSKADTIPVGRILSRAMLSRSGADPKIANRIVEPTGNGATTYVVDKSGHFVTRSGAREAAKFVVPYLFSILLVTAIFISASYLLRGIADEKESRIIEVILSSVTPEELLKGKLIGLAAVGLTQVGLWMALAAVPAMFVFATIVKISALTLAGVVLFFALGFGLYATLMAGLGALGTSYRETQQISGVISLMAFFPLVLITVMIEMPNGALARALSFFPFTAPTAMILRLTSADVPVFDIVLSALSILAGIWLILKISARLFRFGLLIYGKRPTFAETMRWLRQT